MPVDDLLVWAAETSQSKSLKSNRMISKDSADELEPCTEFRSAIRRPPSPHPKMRFFDIGHCAAACSGRCSMHSATHEQQDVVNDANTSLRGVAEALQNQRRSHRSKGRPSFQRIDSQESRLSSNSKPKKSEGKHRNSRLDQAREALLNGNVTLARAIVSEELERLSKIQGQ
jgi:hypothetical protein